MTAVAFNNDISRAGVVRPNSVGEFQGRAYSVSAHTRATSESKPPICQSIIPPLRRERFVAFPAGH